MAWGAIYASWTPRGNSEDSATNSFPSFAMCEPCSANVKAWPLFPPKMTHMPRRTCHDAHATSHRKMTSSCQASTSSNDEQQPASNSGTNLHKPQRSQCPCCKLLYPGATALVTSSGCHDCRMLRARSKIATSFSRNAVPQQNLDLQPCVSAGGHRMLQACWKQR